MEFDDPPKKRSPGPIIATIVTAISAIIIAYVQFIIPKKLDLQATQTAAAQPSAVAPTIVQPFLEPTDIPTETPILQPPVPNAETGRLEGYLTNRAGNPISDVSVSIQNGPETKTDIQGRFVLSEAPAGDQLIVVRPPFGDGQFTLNVFILADQTNPVNIVYDAATSRLGLLSITAPIDGSELEIRQDEVDDQGITILVHRATIYGRSDGLAQIFPNGFEVYVLVSSERDGKFWVQHPPAVVDPNDNEWRANIVLGDVEHPPQPGELWTLIAIAADSDAGFDRIANTPILSLLPPHITSNVITVVAIIQ